MKRLLTLVIALVGAIMSLTPVVNAQSPVARVNLGSGLRIEIMQRGDGVRPMRGQVVLAHYTGTLVDGTVFDTSRDGGEPFAFTLGKGQVIDGWEQGFAMLSVGARARLIIPPDLAYGDRDLDTIPANSTLHFDVEFMDIKKQALADLLQEVIDTEGLAVARERYAALQAKQFSDAFVSEAQLNGLGYHYLLADDVEAAIAVFEWNVEQFPDSANVYDSLGEAWVKRGNRGEALANYRRSLELNPANTNAARYIAALEEATGGENLAAEIESLLSN
jgi:peptidylprolyl isomerase